MADVEIVNKGRQIILPEKMEKKEAITWLERKMKEDEQVVMVSETFNTFPWDGACAFMDVLREMFGWVQMVPTKDFFGETPPKMVDVCTGPSEKDHRKVVWGQVAIPGIDGMFATGAAMVNESPCFALAGKVKQKHKDKVEEIALAIRNRIKSHSIYRSKAIRVVTAENGKINADDPPTFIDLSKVKEEELIFSDDVMSEIQASLFAPIELTDAVRKVGTPLKRGVLLEGKYGTGKTLTAYITAAKGTRNGWTFLYLDKVSGLKATLRLAQRYAPAIVFAEDIDREVEGDRSVKMDEILNMIDGVDVKDGEVLTLLTTNHVEKINKAMLRPGRLDAVISVHAPDATAASNLVRLYARGLVGKGESLTRVGMELDGQIPAVIREVVERSKLHAIYRLKSADITLTEDDIVKAARGMKRHLALLSEDNKAASPADRLASSLGEVVTSAMDGNSVGESLRRILAKVES